MGDKVSFDDLKALVSITDCAAWCGIKLKQTGTTFRGDCQLCGEERSFTLTPEKGMWGCFKCQKRGTVIDMVFHFKQTANIRDAALMLQQHFLGNGTVPTKATNSPEPSGNSPPVITEKRREDGEPLKPLDYLEADHPIVQPLGLTPEVCQALGWGFAKKGTMRGRFLVALRRDDGKLVGYLGIATTEEMIPMLAFPKNLPQMLEQPVQHQEEQKAEQPYAFLRVVK